MPLRRSHQPATRVFTPPRDVEALEQVLIAFDRGVADEHEARVVMTDTLVSVLGLTYGSRWVRHADGTFRLLYETGELVGRLPGGDVALEPKAFPSSMLSRAVTGRCAVVERDEGDQATPTADCLRWRAAHQAGARAAAIVPIFGTDGAVQAVMEFFGTATMPRFDDDKWTAIARIASLARRQAVAAVELRHSLEDRVAVTSVVSRISGAGTVDAAIRVALDAVRESFGWSYGSFWALDEQEQLLRFSVESGSAGEEFRAVTLSASFAEGVGLSGRAWRARDLVFVPDLAQVTDCVRAPAAQRAGVKSGVCFPILDGQRMLGTMDFFVTETIELSESRAAALATSSSWCRSGWPCWRGRPRTRRRRPPCCRPWPRCARPPTTPAGSPRRRSPAPPRCRPTSTAWPRPRPPSTTSSRSSLASPARRTCSP
ncbi:GAF domain-containing protein [Jannaschia sp. R86511]|uniref:GAF domain-containing protein n=1 Tax=Jannaschia sp. R86511 TaxID=3093853 RepID=UPI0036D325E8